MVENGFQCGASAQLLASRLFRSYWCSKWHGCFLGYIMGSRAWLCWAEVCGH